jgi:uncharacterized membrane protein YgcG
MKGFIPRTALGLGLSLFTLAGCAAYRDIVDPCWPERYNALARQSVNDATNAQASNGHILDQTVWNYFFKTGKNGAPTDELNAAGIEKLTFISRRRPAPDTRIFLATAQDIPGLAEKAPDKAIAERLDLNNRRIAAVQKFLTVQTNGLASYQIEIHDPAEVYIDSLGIVGSLPTGRPREVLGGYQKLQDNFQGIFAGPQSVSQTVGGGSSGGGSGGGGSGGGSSGGR